MVNVPAWSHSRLEAHGNCPRQFHEVQVLKNVKDVKGPATIWGEEVHKHFENRLRSNTPLPEVLAMHEDFMAFLSALPGKHFVEQKIALNKRLEACTYFGDPDIWYRGGIDFMAVCGDTARLVDHKTGKHKNNFGQLKLFALHTFHTMPQVNTVRADYYWTQLKATNGETYTRDMIPDMWSQFTPKLKQYAQSFQDDCWPPRQSGLCAGWCPVTGCEFWRPKRQPR